MPTPLVDIAAELAADLAPDSLHHLAESIFECKGMDWQQRRGFLLEKLPQPRQKQLLGALLDEWQTQPAVITHDAVALALHVAATTAERYRREQLVELVWTGPETESIPLRRTEQALLEVINTAQRELLVVSFAVYKADSVVEALIAANARGVRLRICLEAPEPSGGRIAYDTVEAIGREVERRADIFVWPTAKRPIGANGKLGSLHVKCAVADASHLFISSANLTGYAMTTNMELGALIKGGLLPGSVANHFNRLMTTGILTRISRPQSDS